MNQEVDIFIQEGLAFVPVNKAPYGDHVQMITKDGNTISVRTSIASFLLAVLHLFGIDMATTRNQYGRAIGRKQLVPIPLSYACTLVPFKTRRPIGNQSTLGWFIAEDILSLTFKSRKETSLLLSNKQTIDVLHDLDWCERQLRNVVLVQHRYRKLHDQMSSPRVEESRNRYRPYN